MNITLPYGDTILTSAIPWASSVSVLDVAAAPPISDLADAMLDGLEGPIGRTPPLSGHIPPNGTILIVVSDSFRKTGADEFLPPLLNYLTTHGVSDDRIAFLYATGSHRAPTAEEQRVILGDGVYAHFRERAMPHTPGDASNLVYRGATSRGTPVYINKHAIEAGLVILTGTVVLHYFGGFGGGRKAMVPGIAGLETIAANHALNLDPNENQLNADVAIGRLAGNPVAEDMLEAARLGPPCFLINTVLNRAGAISGLYCGDLEAAHLEACDAARRQFTVPIKAQADLVIASAGAAKNFVQSHKALYNAYQAVKPGGLIVLAAPAPEGYGGNRFLEWIRLGSREAIIAELRKNAEINGQTALSTLEKARMTLFLSEMSATEVSALGGRKAESLDNALELAREHFSRAGNDSPTCYIMPSAGYTVPVFSVP